MFYNFDGGKLYYKVSGQDNKTSLVFLHGVAMDHITFESQIVELEKQYKIIVLDLPNHGKSSHLDHRLPYSKTCAHLVIKLLNHLNIDRAILIGQSLGSFIVSHAANLYPEKVIATVHIGGGGLYPKSSILLKAVVPFISPMIMLIPNKYMFKMFAKHKALQKQTQDYLEKSSAKTGKHVIIHLTKAMLLDMVEGISTPIEQPTLILYGDHEAGFVKKMNIKFNETLENSKLTIIKNAHHIANQDNPTDFTKELITFITDTTKEKLISQKKVNNSPDVIFSKNVEVMK
ncbi:alpha/beta fold hydrolase [Alkalihalobacterium chitinilyticum]|uniref:Alpha/beta hydrolase n=1 Tax=Alkalihalobacterium chitinilyticum TaxID=2980103 RepID=A0ABT5VFT5_9BACI|nr:alpha/beta hydrolase [Alkalihalobacterium chitinilyticum]MDE5414294.1 alpha/beta hydrolase [Alkalihalobacterium chitinilyticum]